MKIARHHGAEVEAGASAPERARCPVCGEPVDLRRWKRGDRVSWYYRHARGKGAGCSERLREIGRCAQGSSRSSKPERVIGEPHLTLAAFVVERTLEDAREGNDEALLALAFSPVIHLALGMVDLGPEEVWDELIADGANGHRPDLWVSSDPSDVLAPLSEDPGPVLDVRDDGRHLPEALAQSPWYVPLPHHPGPVQVRMIRRVLHQVERLYVLGNRATWSRVVGGELVASLNSCPDGGDGSGERARRVP